MNPTPNEYETSSFYDEQLCASAATVLPYLQSERGRKAWAALYEAHNPYEELADADRLRDKMSGILRATAYALHGGELEDGLLSWHDLPTLAERLRAALERWNAMYHPPGSACSKGAPCDAREALREDAHE